MLILQNKKKLEPQQIWLYDAYKKIVKNIIQRACNGPSSIDPFASKYYGKNIHNTDSNYYDALLEITSYFHSSKGGRGKLLEKTISFADKHAKNDVYLSSFLDQIISSNQTIQGKTLQISKKKFDLINLINDSLIICEIKNRIDSGGVSGRRDALTKFFDVISSIEQNRTVFVDDNSKKEYTLVALLSELKITKIEMIMGLLYNITGDEATISDDKKNGFYGESKKLSRDFSKGKLGVMYDGQVKINFEKDGVEFLIETVYGSETTKRFTDGSLTLGMMLEKVFPKVWDDLWLGLKVGIKQRDLFLSYKTNHITHIKNNYTKNKFKSNIEQFRENPNDLNLLKDLTSEIQNGGGVLTVYQEHIHKMLQIVCMCVWGFYSDLTTTIQGFTRRCLDNNQSITQRPKRKK